ncbi:putative holin [Enterobacter asburiae]|uniref:putative holin n=1 Tax=Enterobacter asburiae TaxID=61645 RepID=UPI0011D239C3|nr:putative holin [Enterobacter asburiae]
MMLINLFGELYGPVVIAAFSGAMLFILLQHTFRGLNKLLVFLVSFFMGITGADTAVSLAQRYLPADIHMDRAVGAFLCSALIVSVAMTVISRVEHHRHTGHQA